jgi:hypothetical protein
MRRAGRPIPSGPLSVLVAGLCVLLGGPGDGWAQASDPAAERQMLQEANRTLQEEIRLAAKPQTYLLIDVAQGLIVLKTRGVEVHRFTLLSWDTPGGRPSAGLFRLAARPPVDRPRTKPGEDATEHPIELSDMPAEYQLSLAPAGSIFIAPPIQEQPWLRARSFLREWWARLTALSHSDSKSSHEWLRLSLSIDQARSLAWSVTDTMPILIGRTTVSETKSP